MIAILAVLALAAASSACRRHAATISVSLRSINLPEGDALWRQVAATQSQLSNVLSRELEQAMFAVAMDEVSPETNDAAIETYISDNQSPQ